MPATPKSTSSKKSAPTTVSERVSAYRSRLSDDQYHRVDVPMPNEKRDRIKEVATSLGSSYGETVSALAQYGLEQWVFRDAIESSPRPPASSNLIPRAEPMISSIASPMSFAQAAMAAPMPDFAASLRSVGAASSRSFQSSGSQMLSASANLLSSTAVTVGEVESSPHLAGGHTTAADDLAAFFRKPKG